MDEELQQDEGIEVVGIPRAKLSVFNAKGTKGGDTSSTIHSSFVQTFLMPQAESNKDHSDIKRSRQNHLGKGKEDAKSKSIRLFADPTLSCEAPPNNMQVATHNQPVIHVDGDPISPSFRVVGVSDTDGPKKKPTEPPGKAPRPKSDMIPNLETETTFGVMPVPRMINADLNQTTSTTLTDDHEDDFDDEPCPVVQENFLQLDIESLEKHNTSVKAESFRNEEDTEQLQAEKRTSKSSHEPRNYLQLTKNLIHERKERDRRERVRTQKKRPISTPPRIRKPCCSRGTRFLIGVILALAGAGLVVFIVILTASRDGSSNVAGAIQDTNSGGGITVSTGSSSESDLSSTITNGPLNTNAPSLPDQSNDAAIGPIALEDLPETTRKIVSSNDPQAAQVKAFQWLLEDPFIASYPRWQQFQRMALAILFYSTNGPNWKYASDWLSYEISECQWLPQACDSHGRLQRLLLAASNLAGTLPAEIGWLTSLQQLQVYGNSMLYGSIPTEIGFLTNLQVLWMQDCSFASKVSPAIPTEIGRLTSLLYLDVSNNPLGQLTNDDGLVGNENSAINVGNDIPSEIGLLTSLQELILSDANLVGTLPTELGNLQQLQYSLQIRRNGLTGTLISELGQLEKLEVFYADNNQFEGELPKEFQDWTNIRLLDLSVNRLEGSLRRRWGMQMEKLEEVWLYDNLISGSIPRQWGSLTSMTSLDMSMNQLSNSIPSELCQLTGLTGLWLYQNNLAQEIPDCIGDLNSNLLQLSLFGNQISGILPSGLADLTKLRGLWLDENRIEGPVPSGLLGLTNLVALHLFSNQLSGTLPSFPEESYFAMQDLRLYDNMLSGRIPRSIERLHFNLQFLQLHENELSGYLPEDELLKLTKLEELTLQGNSLSGRLSDICDLEKSPLIKIDCGDVSCHCCSCSW